MVNIYRKNHLARNLNKIKKSLPRFFDFYPKTWVLPREQKQFLDNFRVKKKKDFYQNLTKGKLTFRDINSIIKNQNIYFNNNISKKVI